MLTSEQREERRSGIGSSDIAAVVGCSPYDNATPHTVWLSKMALADFEGNEATEHGDEFEEPISRIYARKTESTVERHGRTVVGAESWMMATPDFMVTAPFERLLEIKLVGPRSVWSWGRPEDGANGVPVDKLVQVQWQMHVTGYRIVDIAACLGGTETRVYTIRYDLELGDLLEARARDFWHRYVLTKSPPPIDGTEGAREMVKRLFPRSERAARYASQEEEQLAALLLKARADTTAAETEERRLGSLMQSAMGETEALIGDGWRVRWKTTKKGTRPFCFEHGLEKERKSA